LSKDFPQVRRVIWGRSVERARDMAREVGGGAHEGSLTEAMEADDVEVVFVTTPPDTHLDFTLQALAAGKHVIVEKPAFRDSAEFDRVETAAAQAGRSVLVAENYYYKPLLQRLRDIIASDTLGQVRLIEINAVKRQTVEGWRNDPARAGGGALFEGGIHWVSLMANLGLEIRTAHGYLPDAPAGYERSALFVAEYSEGAVGVLAYSWEIPSTLRGLRLSRIWGTRASLLFESNGLFVLRGGRRPRIWFPGLVDIQGYRAMLRDFVRALTTGTPPAFSLEAARRDVELVRSAYASPGGTPVGEWNLE
jgi:predicted dehydrogenase